MEKDSALDFSFLNHVPAGKFGRVVAEGDHFEFAERPGEPVRFYGVNLCWSAHELTHAQSDLLAVRLARLGFNSVRIHHYDMMLTERAQNRLEFDAERLDRLDYLIARLKEAGIYVTIDRPGRMCRTSKSAACTIFAPPCRWCRASGKTSRRSPGSS